MSSHSDFDSIIDSVIESEGGYINDKIDPGGETKYGISKRAYPDVDIKNLTKDGAKAIYFSDYWHRAKVAKIPARLREIFFDMCVNFGITGATRVLQKACNGKNKKDIVVDGKIGRKTISASKNVELDRLRSYRVLRFAQIVFKNPTMEKFWYGWYRRAVRV
jgi:lysozyme family protein